MVVPVALVGRMTVAVVRIVHVVTVRDRHMPAALTVDVVVAGVLVMPGGLALVRVAVVLTVQMTVVRVVDVIIVRDRHVPTAFAVRVVVSGMRLVLQGCCHAVHLHVLGPPSGQGRRQRTLAMLLPLQGRLP
ncbi:hypothetical protein WQO_02590 [Streptomyces globisporus C-1027]|uniref:Uncharacterized protein n=1 Tax=Streptomyces globisporus C-1027 TaxID=1172567 RepID=A0A0U3BRA6_STRGL|nr:hypothetical protein WQO_02590 [Streptomyces globisporus C-1027]